MGIEELVKRIREYDNVLYGEYGRGVLIVEKNGMYGVTNLNGDIIVPCKYKEYSDVYHAWERLGFTTTVPSELPFEQKARDILIDAHDKMVESKQIGRIEIPEVFSIISSQLVKLNNGDLGVAMSFISYIPSDGAQKTADIIIKDADGNIVKNIFTEGIPTLCTDSENLYFATYNNQRDAEIACYRQGTFEEVWRIQIPGCNFQSITVNDNYVITFDMKNNMIKYFDKKTGEHLKEKDINTDGWHHHLASNNENLLAGSMGFKGFKDTILKCFDNKTSQLLAENGVPISEGMLSSIAADNDKKRLFVALDDKILVLENETLKGIFCAPTNNITNLSFNEENGALLLSMKHGSPSVEIYTRDAIDKLLNVYNSLIKTNDDTKQIGGSKK